MAQRFCEARARCQTKNLVEIKSLSLIAKEAAEDFALQNASKVMVNHLGCLVDSLPSSRPIPLVCATKYGKIRSG